MSFTLSSGIRFVYLDEAVAVVEQARRELTRDDGSRPRQLRTEQVRDKVLAAAGQLALEGAWPRRPWRPSPRGLRQQADPLQVLALARRRGARGLHAERRHLVVAARERHVAESLEALAVAAVDLFTETPAGPLMRSLVADAQSQDEIAWRSATSGSARRAVAADLIRKAIGTGEFRADLDVEVVLDLLLPRCTTACCSATRALTGGSRSRRQSSRDRAVPALTAK